MTHNIKSKSVSGKQLSTFLLEQGYAFAEAAAVGSAPAKKDPSKLTQ